MSNAGNPVALDQFKSQLNGPVKGYHVYDGSDRLTELYVAPMNAVNGSPCLKTTYNYVAASNRVLKFKEEMSTWVSATMDI